MKSRITKTVALAALMSGAAGAAHAVEGWYGSASVGYSIDGEVDISTNGGYAWGDVNTRKNFDEHLAIGYSFDNGFRLEGELGSFYNRLQPTAAADLADDVFAWSAMLNGYYDFNHRGHGIHPYIGAGIGYARVSLDDYSTVIGGPGTRSIDDSDNGWAWQGMAGLSFDIGDRMALDVGYRYFDVPNLSMTAHEPVVAHDHDVEYIDQSVNVGLRWQFAAPPPPPPPPPPPAPPPPPPPPPPAACPESDFTVYFEWDRSNLNQAAMDTIDAAVNRARECNLTHADVVGHTDTSGSAAYNIGLSNRRASVVRDALVVRGISADMISAHGVGETDLARPTRDGVREPLNRRTAVTITFH